MYFIEVNFIQVYFNQVYLLKVSKCNFQTAFAKGAQIQDIDKQIFSESNALQFTITIRAHFSIKAHIKTAKQMEQLSMDYK